jgi:pyruvoyl-dependent arginine decarboxylase (PvlArgDC)
MVIKTLNAGYDICEEIEVDTEGVTAVVCRSLSPGEVIDQVLARVKTPAVRSAGACNLTVGDDDNSAGYLAAADAKATAGTIYGTVPTERGSYLYDGTVKAGYIKAYTAVKSLKIVLSAAPDTQATVQVVVFGHRIALG